MKSNDYSLVIMLILISNYLTSFTRNFSDTSINTNKNYANLNYANELKKAFGNVSVNACLRKIY